MVIARSFDILFCTWVYKEYDLTISSMCGLELKKENPRLWARTLGWCLNKIQKDHCLKAIINDISRAEEALEILHKYDKS